MHYQVLFMTISHCIDMVPATGIPILLLPSWSHPAQQLVNSCGTFIPVLAFITKTCLSRCRSGLHFILVIYDSVYWYPSNMPLTLCFLHWWAQQRNKEKKTPFSSNLLHTTVNCAYFKNYCILLHENLTNDGEHANEHEYKVPMRYSQPFLKYSASKLYRRHSNYSE